MSRAVFLPTPGDPFLLKLWFKYYKLWFEEIDTLYILVNSVDDEAVINYIKSNALKFPNVSFRHVSRQMEHGEALENMFEKATEDHVMFVEDDCFIFRSGSVDASFKLLESGDYDVVGSPRGSCSKGIWDMAQNKWGLDYSGVGDVGPNFWPNFFFTSREILNNTSKHFGAKTWQKGELIRGLELEAEEMETSDTFVAGSLEVRGLVPKEKILHAPQYHGATDDMKDYHERKNLWDGRAWMVHAGSLSSGYKGLLNTDRWLDSRSFITQQEKLELERRVAFWSMAIKEAEKDIWLAPYKQTYGAGIYRLVSFYGLNKNRIEKRIKIYERLMEQ